MCYKIGCGKLILSKLLTFSTDIKNAYHISQMLPNSIMMACATFFLVVQKKWMNSLLSCVINSLYSPVTYFCCRNLIPSFAALSLDGDSSQMPFANSLTITRDDFANFLHCDADKIQIAYGMWWAARLVKDSESNHPHYEIVPEVNHDKFEGGAFILGDFGVAVDCEQYDHHFNMFYKCLLIDFHSLVQVALLRFIGGGNLIATAPPLARAQLTPLGLVPQCSLQARELPQLLDTGHQVQGLHS